MPLPDLFASFLAAALASLIFCFLKIAFDSTATTAPESRLLFHQPSALASSSASPSSSPLAAAATRKTRRRKGLRVSFEDSVDARAQAQAEAEAQRDDDLGALTARGVWVAAGAQGLGLRRGVGRKLSVVLEE